MFRKLKSVVVFLKIIVSFVLTRPFDNLNNDKNTFRLMSNLPLARGGGFFRFTEITTQYV